MFEEFNETRIEVEPGIELHVRTAGSGTPVVLLHGYPQSGLCWHRVAPALAERHTVVVPDLRGYGRSSTPPDDAEHTVYSKRRMAADVVAVMSALGHERFAVVGHDRGGRVAYRTALDHPERVERLCTLDIVPTIEQFEILASSRRNAVFGFHWYFLAVPPPLPEALIGAEPRLYLEQVMGKWSGTVPGAQAITAEAMDSVRRRLHPCGDRRIVRRLPGRGHIRQRPRRRRSNGRADHRLSGPRTVGRSTQRGGQRGLPRHLAAVDGHRPAGHRSTHAVRALHSRGAAGAVHPGAARLPPLSYADDAWSVARAAARARADCAARTTA